MIVQNRFARSQPAATARAGPTIHVNPYWQEQARRCGRMLQRQIRERPGASLAAALMAGVFLGWLIKRR